MAYVTNGGWIDGNSADGMRKCIANDFSSVHIFHLRGNQRTQGELSRREGGKIFGSGSRAPIAITIFTKNPYAKKHNQIYYHDIGDYLDRVEKLEKIQQFGSVRGITKRDKWINIVPDEHGDWLDQRDVSFNEFLELGDKATKNRNTIFCNYALGVSTNRDAWCINPSKTNLINTLESMIDFYNGEVNRWETEKHLFASSGTRLPTISNFVNNDPTRISWSRGLKQNVVKGKRLTINDGELVQCMDRPFSKQWQFYSRHLNEMVSQMPKIFPTKDCPNRVIAVTGRGSRTGFSALMMDAIPNISTIDKSQCFPIWIYQDTLTDGIKTDLFDGIHSNYPRREAITDYGIQQFRKTYPLEAVTREDIFHYIYGLLHSEDYRTRFRANLSKELPRIPCVASVEAYRFFREAGKKLGELHVGYESVEPYPAKIDVTPRDSEESTYRVIKMRHPGTARNKERSVVIYNSNITIQGIPEEAWDYVVNGKPALSWVMERQCVKSDKASGIVSDANLYAIETVGDPRYPLDLFLRVITVSLETMKIVKSLPDLKI